MGLTRHLTAAEIVEQAVYARRLVSDEVGSITNVVFMVGIYFQQTQTFRICLALLLIVVVLFFAFIFSYLCD